MEAFYFKHRHTYLNESKAKDYSYYMISKDGKTLSISMNKRSISSPKTLTFRSDFEPITKEEFEQIKQSIGF